MIIPIYSDELFELITLAEIDPKFLNHGSIYRMVPELELVPAWEAIEKATELSTVNLIDVRIEKWSRKQADGLFSRIQSTFMGFTLCDDELALKIRAAWAPGQEASYQRSMVWRLVP